MQRRFGDLENSPFDLLVVGGGVYGAWMAYDAALRGLSVALIERGDWASGASSASSKLIHGGLRYLERFELSLVRKSLDERRLLARIGRHRIRPLRFVLPVYDSDRVGRVRLRLGLMLYDALAGRDQPVDGHRAVGRGELLRRFGLEPQGLRGGFEFGDCQTDDARLVLELVDGAHGAGAVTVNRARAAGLLLEGRRVLGADVVDEETGRSIQVRAAVTANCAGAWINGHAETRCHVPLRLTKGVHLVLPPLPADEAFLVESQDDGRVVFLLPWYGRTLLGTTDTDYNGSPDEVRVDDSDVRYLLDRANRVLAGTPWNEADVLGSFAGLRALAAGGKATPSAASRGWHLHSPLDRLLVSVGGKYTSARADAAVAVDRVMRELGRPAVECPTRRPFPWRPAGSFTEWTRETFRVGMRLGLDEETIDLAQQRHGSRIDRLFDRVRDAPQLGRRIVPHVPFCAAEVAHAVEDEMARSAEDVLRRRLPLLILSRPDPLALQDAVELAGSSLGWSSTRRREELEALTQVRHVAADVS